MPTRGQKDKQNTTQIIEKRLSNTTVQKNQCEPRRLLIQNRQHSHLCNVNFIHIYAKEISCTFKNENYSPLFFHYSIEYACNLPNYHY